MADEPYVKSERELHISALMRAEEAAEPGSEEKKRLGKELLQYIEGDKYYSQEDVKIILLNGPPRSGKDTATDFALSYLGARGARYRFAAPLKHAIHAMFGINGVDEEHLNSVKDVKSGQFFGLTPRELYIWLSEEVVKPKFGHDFWSKIAVTSIAGIKKQVIVISDCGFVEEAQVLVDAFGEKNVALVRLYREGHDFTNDSRNYIRAVDCEKFDLHNNGTVHDLYQSVVDVIEKFAGANNAE